MKKLLSLLMVAVMVTTILPIAVADEDGGFVVELNNNMSSTQIQVAVTNALARNDIVTVTGRAAIRHHAVYLTIQSGKKVVWKATLSDYIYLDGSGVFEVSEEANLTAPAPIRQANNSTVTVNILGGTLFYRNSTTAAIPNAVVSGNAIVIAWNSDTERRVYQDGTNAHLDTVPADSAFWCAEKRGIVNSVNDTVITIPDVRITTDEYVPIVSDVVIGSANITNFANINSAIATALETKDAITVTGRLVLQTSRTANITIPEGKTVKWRAAVDFGLLLSGSGAFEVADSADINYTGFSLNAISIEPSSAVTLNITGGSIRGRGSENQVVIHSTAENCIINISGGVIHVVETEIPVVNSGKGAKTNFTGGVVFVRGTATAILNTVVSGNAVVIAWNDNANKTFQNGTDKHLVSDPPNSASWCIKNQGVVNSVNSAIVTNIGVTVTEEEYVPVSDIVDISWGIQGGNSIASAYTDNDVVTVIGGTGGHSHQTYWRDIHIPEGKTLIWKASAYFDEVSLRLSGAGTFELAEGANLSMSVINYASSNRNVIWFADDSTVTFNMTGGRIYSASSGAAISSNSPNAVINISGGVISVTTGIPIANNGAGAKTNITGGVIFHHGTTARATSTPANTTIGDNAVIIAWRQSGVTTYTDGTSTDLVSIPANRAKWCIEARGVVNDINDAAVERFVRVVAQDYVKLSDVVTIDNDMNSTQIGTAIQNALFDNVNITVVGSKTNAGGLGISIPPNKKVTWEAVYSGDNASLTLMNDTMRSNGTGSVSFEIAEGAVISTKSGVAIGIGNSSSEAFTVSITGGIVSTAGISPAIRVIPEPMMTPGGPVAIMVTGGIVRTAGSGDVIDAGKYNHASVYGGIVYAQGSAPKRAAGRILSNDPPTAADALEILKYIVGIPSVISRNTDAFRAALIVSKDKPAVVDALEILKYLVGIIEEVKFK